MGFIKVLEMAVISIVRRFQDGDICCVWFFSMCVCRGGEGGGREGSRVKMWGIGGNVASLCKRDQRARRLMIDRKVQAKWTETLS